MAIVLKGFPLHSKLVGRGLLIFSGHSQMARHILIIFRSILYIKLAILLTILLQYCPQL